MNLFNKTGSTSFQQVAFPLEIRKLKSDSVLNDFFLALYSEEGISDHHLDQLNIKMPVEEGAYKKSGKVT